MKRTVICSIALLLSFATWLYTKNETQQSAEVQSIKAQIVETTPIPIVTPEPTQTPTPTPETNTINQHISRGETNQYIPIKAIVTAYAPYDNKSGICNDGTPDTTATNTKPKYGTLASDPSRVPYGTKILIPEYGIGTVEDTGGALRNDKQNIRIDVYVDTYEEAMEWGKKEMTIYIIK